jgi:hypothetical protein
LHYMSCIFHCIALHLMYIALHYISCTYH